MAQSGALPRPLLRNTLHRRCFEDTKLSGLLPWKTSRGEYQTLAICAGKAHILAGDRARQGFDLEIAGDIAYNFPENVVLGTWDNYSESTYFVKNGGKCIMRLDSAGCVEVVAGAEEEEEEGEEEEPVGRDGSGLEARFAPLCGITSDHVGSLYVVDDQRAVRISLPPSWSSTAAAAAGGGGQGAAAGTGQGGATSQAERGSVLCSKLCDFDADIVLGDFHNLAYSPFEGGQLYIVHPNSVYRLQLGLGGQLGPAARNAASPREGAHVGPTAAAEAAVGQAGAGAGGAGPGSAAAATAAAAPVLLAGQPGVNVRADGVGEAALFRWIDSAVVEVDGSLLVLDDNPMGEDMALRRVSPHGLVTTLCYLPKFVDRNRLALLPNGYLAVWGGEPGGLVLCDLGLTLPPAHPGAAAAAAAAAATAAAAAKALPPPPPARTLPCDLGSLLDRQPDGTSDVAVLVGGRTFHAHRGILSARSDYFRTRLEGGFADGQEQQLALPDADPDAFVLVLRYVYTGRVEVPPPLLQAVLALSDRLLLPELCGACQEQLLAGVGPGSVVELLLMAQQGGGSFTKLLEGLKAWYVEHQEEVMRNAEDSVERLAVSYPRLLMELMRMGYERPSKRPRAV